MTRENAFCSDDDGGRSTSSREWNRTIDEGGPSEKASAEQHAEGDDGFVQEVEVHVSGRALVDDLGRERAEHAAEAGQAEDSQAGEESGSGSGTDGHDSSIPVKSRYTEGGEDVDVDAEASDSADSAMDGHDSSFPAKSRYTEGGEDVDVDAEASDSDTDGHDTSPPAKSISTLTRFRQGAGSIVNNWHFQTLIIILIIINAIMMGIGTFDFVTDNPAVNLAFEKTDLAFLIIFTIELVMQFIYNGLGLFKDGWLVFDFVIIILSWSLASLQIIRAFRVFRALRLVTRVSVLRNLITALMSVLPRMTAISALLLLIFYIFAVMFTVLFSDLELSEDYFGRLDSTLFTLLQIMTLDWVNPARECMAYYDWAWAPFVAFVMISAFIVYNLIIAVVCDAVAMVEHGDEEDVYEVSDDDGFSNATDDSAGENISQIKMSDLRDRIEQLIRNEREMQNSIDQALRQLGIEYIDDIPS